MSYIEKVADRAGISMAEFRKIIPGRIPDFAELKKNNVDVEPLFRSIGWTPFFQISEPIYPALVRDFWRTSKVTDVNMIMITGNVGDDNIFITHESLSEILGCSRQGAVFEKEWLNSKGAEQVHLVLYDAAKPPNMNSKYLKPLAKVLHAILITTILQKTGSRDHVSEIEKFALFNLLMGIKTDLVDLVMNHMIKTVRGKQIKGKGKAKGKGKGKEEESKGQIYPFGMILTRIFRKQKVKNLNSYVHAELCTFIGSKSLKLMKIDLDALGQDSLSSEETDTDDDETIAAAVAAAKGKRKVSEDSSSHQGPVTRQRKAVLSSVEEEEEEGEEEEEEQGCNLVPRRKRTRREQHSEGLQEFVSSVLHDAQVEIHSEPSQPTIRTYSRMKTTAQRRSVVILDSSESSEAVPVQEEHTEVEVSESSEAAKIQDQTGAAEFDRSVSPIFVPSPIAYAKPSSPEPVQTSEPLVSSKSKSAEPEPLVPYTLSSPESVHVEPEPVNSSHEPTPVTLPSTPILFPTSSEQHSEDKTEVLESLPNSPIPNQADQNTATSSEPSLSHQIAELTASVLEANSKIDIILANQQSLQQQLAAQQNQIIRLIQLIKP